MCGGFVQGSRDDRRRRPVRIVCDCREVRAKHRHCRRDRNEQSSCGCNYCERERDREYECTCRETRNR